MARVQKGGLSFSFLFLFLFLFGAARRLGHPLLGHLTSRFYFNKASVMSLITILFYRVAIHSLYSSKALLPRSLPLSSVKISYSSNIHIFGELVSLCYYYTELRPADLAPSRFP